jgi:hypothetical protein
MAELGAFFGNPNIQRQGARARALAGQRDVNTLPDPLTYAVMQGLLGTRPDEMGFSVLNPDYEKIKKVAEPAFALGLLGQAAPALAPLTKGLPVGASIKNVGKDLSAIQIGDRTIPVTINRIDKKSGGELVNVNPSAFDEAFSKTSWQYVGEKGKDGISGRYEKFENYLKDANSIEASNVSVNKDGGIVFGDGRHRYAVLRDMGLDELPIVMDKESIKNAQKFGYLADTKASLPVEEGLLATQSKQPMQGLLGQEVTDYRGSHQAPSPDFGAPLYDLTGGGQMYPADVYSSKAAQFYGGNLPYDQKAFSIAQQYKDKPDALVTIYRAVPKDISNSEKLATLEKQMAAYMKRGTLPKDAENYSSGSKWYDSAYERRESLRKMPDEPSNDISTINAGDWVTLTKEYAKDHGESALKGEYKILSKKVKAKEVWTNADSIHEFGYQPQASATDEQKLKQITSLLE